MPKAKDEIADALESYGMPRSSADFDNAETVLRVICKASGLSAAEVLAALKENLASHGYAAMDKVAEIRKKIGANWKEIERLEKRIVDAEKRANWMLNVPSKESDGPVMSRIGGKLHEYLVNAYYTWKISREENEIAKLEAENRKLEAEAAQLPLVVSAVKLFMEMAHDSTLAGVKLRRGAEAIEKHIRKCYNGT